MKKILFTTLALVLAVGLSLPMATPVTAGTVALYHFDEGSGTTAYDSSGNGFDGTISGAVWDSNGMFNYALSLDGSNDYVDCGADVDNGITSGLTVEAWIKCNSYSQRGGIVSNDVTYFSPHQGYDFFIWDGQLYMDVGNGGTVLGRISSPISGSGWHHVAGTWDGITVRLYIDGSPVGTPASLDGTYFDPTENTWIGKINYTTDWTLNGLIDEVRIWDEALTADQIAQRYVDPVITTEITSGESEVGIGAEESWDITIKICGGPEDVENVVVQDGMGGDLDQIELDGTPVDPGDQAVSVTVGTAELQKMGKGEKGANMVIWEVGDLDAGECAELVVTVTTGFNAKDKHSFTLEEEDHALDGGASATYWYDELEYETPETIPLTVDVVAPRLYLYEKDSNWDIVPGGASGLLTYNFIGRTFDYKLSATGLQNSIPYSLIYYADPWPGDNGTLIATFTTDVSGNIAPTLDPVSVDLEMDLPNSDDDNHPDGAKIWLVPSSDYNEGSNSMNAWNPSDYLFEHNMITYYDKDD